MFGERRLPGCWLVGVVVGWAGWVLRFVSGVCFEMESRCCLVGLLRVMLLVQCLNIFENRFHRPSSDSELLPPRTSKILKKPTDSVGFWIG